MRQLALACTALAGCYAATHVAVTAPVGHGHGGADGDFDIALGTEYSDTRLNAGGGFDFGLRHAEDQHLVAAGLEGHAAVAVGGHAYGDGWRPLVVANVVLGFGQGGSDDETSDSPSGYFAQAFAGFGLGSTTTQRSYDIRAGHIALGLTATRFWLDGSDAFWMLGGALELSFGWFQQR